MKYTYNVLTRHIKVIRPILLLVFVVNIFISTVKSQDDTLIYEIEESWLPSDVTEYDFEPIEGYQEVEVEIVDTNQILTISLPKFWKYSSNESLYSLPVFRIFPSDGQFSEENNYKSLITFTFILVEVEDSDAFWTEPMNYIASAFSSKLDENDIDIDLELDGFIEKLDSTKYGCEIKFITDDYETDQYLTSWQINSKYSIVILSKFYGQLVGNYYVVKKEGYSPRYSYDSDFLYDYEIKELVKETTISFLDNLSFDSK